jgi:glycosyltransferase involved in cell wall biosynthesis
MVYGNIDIIDGNGRPLRDSHWYRGYQVPEGSEHISLPRDVSELNVVANNYVGAAFLYRSRVAWLLGDYSPRRFTTEDYDYWMRVNGLLTLRHFGSEEAFYEYRFHSKSLTARDHELGITAGRVKLLAFEDFRRDFYLTPMIWWLEADHGMNAKRLVRALKRSISKAGHVLFADDDYGLSLLPRLWMPLVYVRIVDDPNQSLTPPRALPESAVRVLVSTENVSLPEAVNGDWHLCIDTACKSPPPVLEGAYRGWLTVREPGPLFHALDVRVRSHHLNLIEAETERPANGRLKASVIICTHQPSERLARAVGSVAQQTLPWTSYEIILVNNKPWACQLQAQIDELQEKFFADRPGQFRPIVCPIAGLSHARNAGISEATSEMLCFLDDDAVANEDWLEIACDAFAQQPEAAIIGGHIVLKAPEPRSRVLSDGWERYWSQYVTGYEETTEISHWWEFPWGANWCARRKVLVEMGGFRCRYGRRGNDFSGGEEIVAASLAQRLGYKIAVAPKAVVRHDVDPRRYTFRHVRRTIIAGTMVNFQCQRDLYLPMEATFRGTLRNLFSLAVDRTLSTPYSLVRARHWLYRRESWCRLLFAQFRCLCSRLQLRS